MSDLKIFTENIEPDALDQIYTLIKQPAFARCKVRIMPDVHAGAGCVIGFTADLGEKIIPNIVGVDIGCGMLTIRLKERDIDLQRLDETIRRAIPSGRDVQTLRVVRFPQLQELKCFPRLKDPLRLERSIGTLGGGNHFIEIDTDENGEKYLIIHSGSRNLGKQVAEYYQRLAVEQMQGLEELKLREAALIAASKTQSQKRELQRALKELRSSFRPKPLTIPKELCYLTGDYREDYLHDMAICQQFAVENRRKMAEILLRQMGLTAVEQFETIHNYIELNTNMVRKGAVSAKAGELLLIPINMRDGCIIARGKGNPDWNCSAPHGAGRLLSRSQARAQVSMEEYRASMTGIYTTSVQAATIDESPMVYKPMDEIIRNIQDTVDIVKIIKPIYNFKASE